MQTTLARIDSQPPDWGQVGGWLAAVLGAAAAIWTGFKGGWKGPGQSNPAPGRPDPTEQPVSTIAQEGNLAVRTLERLVETINDQLEQAWKRIREQDQELEQMRQHSGRQDTAIYQLQGQVARLRQKLIDNRIDPGEM